MGSETPPRLARGAPACTAHSGAEQLRQPTREHPLGRRCRPCPRPVPGRSSDDGSVKIVLDPAQCQDVEHALATVENVDQLVTRGDHHRVLPVDHEVGGGDVLAELVAQVAEHLPHRFELQARVQQLLDDLQLQQVAIGVPSTRAGPFRIGERRSHEVGSGPVVELAVADSDDLGGLTAAEAVLRRSPRCISERTGCVTSLKLPRRAAIAVDAARSHSQ